MDSVEKKTKEGNEPAPKGANSSRFINKYLWSPWLHRQVESHLIFGPISKHVSFGWIFSIIIFIILVVGFFTVKKPPIQYVGWTIDKLILLSVGVILIIKLSKMQQAIIGWIAVKFALGFAAIIMMTVGSMTSLAKNQTDALPNFLLGFIWVPWLEFIPKITPHQKHVTIGRIVLSIPVVYMGIQSGFWHW